MTAKHGTRMLVTYAGVVTTVLALMAFTRSGRTIQEFDEIIVHRIKVVEPDGTLRMVISNHDRFPGVIEKGKELGPNRRPGAGMLFLNDEGTENGGLIFGGRRDADGKLAAAGVSLSFDKYGVPGNMVQLAGISDDNDRFAGLRIKDSKIGGNSNRIWVGNSDDGSATVALMDAQGRRRIVMDVKADGASSLTFLDANGKVLNQLLPSGAPR